MERENHWLRQKILKKGTFLFSSVLSLLCLVGVLVLMGKIARFQEVTIFDILGIALLFSMFTIFYSLTLSLFIAHVILVEVDQMRAENHAHAARHASLPDPHALSPDSPDDTRHYL